MEWPLLGIYYLEGRSPLRPKQAVSLAQGHVTIPAGASHVLTHEADNSARLHLPLSSHHTYQARLSCDELTLREAAKRDWTQKLPENARGLLAPTMLYDAPNGDPLGFVGSQVDSVLTQEWRGEWARVTSVLNERLLFDGWVAARDLKQEPNYLIFLREDPRAPTHVTRPGARVYVKGEPVRAEVAAGTPLLLGRRENSLVEVAIAGLWEGNGGNLSLRLEDVIPVER